MAKKPPSHGTRRAIRFDGNGTQRRRARPPARLGLPASAAFVCAGLLGLCSGIGAGFYGTLVTSAVLRAGPHRPDWSGDGCAVLRQLRAVPITYALTGLITDVSGAQVPFLIGGSLVLWSPRLLFSQILNCGI